MKKGTLIINFLLLSVFLIILLLRFTDSIYIQKVQFVFFILIIIHIFQHRKIIYFSFKNLFKK